MMVVSNSENIDTFSLCFFYSVSKEISSNIIDDRYVRVNMSFCIFTARKSVVVFFI